MGRELSRAELDELLAAYALDAVEGDERDQVEEYLARNPAARAHVDSLREAAALLASVASPPPEGLWSRIEDSLSGERGTDGTEVPRVRWIGATRSRRRRRVLASVAAAVSAAAVATIAVLAVEVANDQDRIDQLAATMSDGAMQRAAQAARTEPGARTVRLASTDGARSANVVMLPDGTGYFLENDLPSLAADRTYQLWAMVGDPDSPDAISVALLGRDAGVTAFRVAGDPVGFAVTAEPAPGVVSPSHAAVLRGTV